MNVDIARAVALLQRRITFYESRDHWRTEQAEEAANLLLAQPHRQGDPEHLVRNALADARRKLSRRAEILSQYGPETGWLEEQTSDDFAYLLIEITDFLRRSVTPSDQDLLELAFRGEIADQIAVQLGLPLARVREELSRARARARNAREAHAQKPRSSPIQRIGKPKVMRAFRLRSFHRLGQMEHRV